MRGLIYKDISISSRVLIRNYSDCSSSYCSAYFQCWNLCWLICFRYVCHDNRWRKNIMSFASDERQAGKNIN